MFAARLLTAAADSSKYEGQFSNGKYHGYGVYSRGDGMRYEGAFRDGQVCLGFRRQIPSSPPGLTG